MSNEGIKEIKGGVTAAKGFMAASTAAGIKYQGREDMAFIYSDEPCECAGTFTKNKVKAACVKWDRELVTSGKKLHAVVINSGIANACTGAEGYEACRKTAAAVEKAKGVPTDSVAVASTGVIGMHLPIDKLEKGVEEMSRNLSGDTEAGTKASKAIMTTDTVNKEIAVSFMLGGREVIIGGMSKGSGMIHPDMCTMLAFLTTDADIDRGLLQKAVSEIIDDSFNMITVDGDTSTNDTFMILANGLAGNERISDEGEDYKLFKQALFYICRNLARRMAADGEGATKLFEARVMNAVTKEDAKKLARSVVGSNLSKAAIFGCDANFGRFLCAMGYSGADFKEEDVELYFESSEGKLKVFDHGIPLDFDEGEAVRIMKADEVSVVINMNEGSADADAWGCDLTYDYVKINADYRS
ncbi:MAG: bifunctional glutamate N-acetyltransferase/amino-acid acetyltransferase ArgJ [Lachnospiraceae bacterium]|nr:bifunctional glutamate N-acetyltransferase/amino-acid acetyltransferase ArgJ [Lachnospiraceae bacterium]